MSGTDGSFPGVILSPGSSRPSCPLSNRHPGALSLEFARQSFNSNHPPFVGVDALDAFSIL